MDREKNWPCTFQPPSSSFLNAMALFFSFLLANERLFLSFTEKAILTLVRSLKLILNFSVKKFKQTEDSVQRRKGVFFSQISRRYSCVKVCRRNACDVDALCDFAFDVVS